MVDVNSDDLIRLLVVALDGVLPYAESRLEDMEECARDSGSELSSAYSENAAIAMRFAVRVLALFEEADTEF
tara:strand:+ start:287 stop:502 length:216 start_codon:yes stop_codon:yes gene_type:complete